MKFIADEMLGKLAKWLRFLGYDTLYAEKISDAEIMLIAENEDRIILTRDHGFLHKKCLNLEILFIRFDQIKDQLIQLRADLNIQFTHD